MPQMSASELLDQLEHLNSIGIALSSEKDPARLLERILLGAKEITNADGGTLYTVVDDQALKFEIILTDSLNFAMGGTSGEKIPFPPIPLYTPDGKPNDQAVAAYTALSGKAINIPDAYTAEGFDFSGPKQFDEKTGYRSTSFLTVPMKNHEDDIIGVLQLINAQDPATGEIIPFAAEKQSLAESLASQAAIAMTNQSLIDDMQQLFESMIELIANAIDEKSPYTGGHCRRVPEITMMLAKAAHQRTDGALKDFRLNDNDWYELKIAAWLHDCGKITTPEYVVDKATKLETIYDRVNTVDLRFELIKKDLEIAALRHQLDQGDSTPTESLDHEIAVLDEEREFIRKTNVGGEFLHEANQQRVLEIAQRTFTAPGNSPQPLLDEEEVKNLSIQRGTLTDEERTIINHHIEATINMLESMPFPKHLKNVPEFAGGHHERMDGKGYPKGLKREQMSVQARIMGIADIFEALTAKDRPYKSGKTLTQSLNIMARMKLDGHIDPELFNIFLEEKVYLDYAKDFLDPEQIDEVDISTLPGYD